MRPFTAEPSGTPAFTAYAVFTSKQPECPNTLCPVNRIRYQYRNIQSYDAG